MEYLKVNGEFPRLSPGAVTLGKFDGIHRGHRKLVERVLQKRAEGLRAVLFAVDAAEKRILSRTERAALLEQMGIDVLLECPLDDRFRHRKAESFVKEILVDRLQAACVVVGEDYRFGYERKGTPRLLQEMGEEYGFRVEVVPKELDGRRKVSSTYIREELHRGNMEKAAALLGMDYPVCGVVEHGRGLGHKMLLPTANIVPPREKLTPPNGVYITLSHFGKKVYRGITNIGCKPTVGEDFIGVETYLYDCGENLYGKECRVEFKHFLRPERKFSSLEALRSQLFRDAEAGENYFESKKTVYRKDSV